MWRLHRTYIVQNLKSGIYCQKGSRTFFTFKKLEGVNVVLTKKSFKCWILSQQPLCRFFRTSQNIDLKHYVHSVPTSSSKFQSPPNFRFSCGHVKLLQIRNFHLITRQITCDEIVSGSADTRHHCSPVWLHEPLRHVYVCVLWRRSPWTSWSCLDWKEFSTHQSASRTPECPR